MVVLAATVVFVTVVVTTVVVVTSGEAVIAGAAVVLGMAAAGSAPDAFPLERGGAAFPVKVSTERVTDP